MLLLTSKVLNYDFFLEAENKQFFVPNIIVFTGIKLSDFKYPNKISGTLNFTLILVLK